MSVRKGDRGEGELQVINASKDLLSYTYDRVRDKEIFPKSERWLLAKNVWDNAVGARVCIVRANAVRVETKEDAELRLRLNVMVERLLHGATVAILVASYRIARYASGFASVRERKHFAFISNSVRV